MSQRFGYFRLLTSFLIAIVFTIFLLPFTVAFYKQDDSQTLQPVLVSSVETEERTPKEIRNMMFVSTADGSFSALDLDNEGKLMWKISTDPGDMLSASITKIESVHKGQLVRLIPSLSGGLYVFNGESVEAVPFTADTLLQSSVKFSEDVLVAGGKDSRSYGINLENGKLHYMCSMDGCFNSSQTTNADLIMVLRRHTQTVRAIEPRLGIEKWNFSVSQHEALFLADANVGSLSSPVSKTSNVKIIVPEGLVCGMTGNKNVLAWKHQFNSPVVHAWKFRDGQLVKLDIFNGGKSTYHDENPVLYIGTFNNFLYVQEAAPLHELTLTITKVPSLKIQAIAGSSNRHPQIGFEEKVEETALAILKEDTHPYSAGFLFYPSSASRIKESTVLGNSSTECDLNVNEEEEDTETIDDSDETPVQIMITSLWYWWKEVLLISITTGIAMNVIIARPRFEKVRQATANVMKSVLRIPDKEEDKKDLLITVDNIEPASLLVHHNSQSSSSGQGSVNTPMGEYQSRYLSDFEPVCRLGKGGFGVVFEARNKIDDCCYAVKRIPLPSKKESRDKVLREVRALAKLDHHNIVRYFHSWLEFPPPGWAEEQDIKFNSDSTVESLNTTTEDDTSIYPMKIRGHSRNKSVSWVENELNVNQSRLISEKNDSESWGDYSDKLNSDNDMLISNSSDSGVGNNNNLIQLDDSSSIIFTNDSRNSTKICDSRGQNSIMFLGGGDYNDTSSSVVFRNSRAMVPSEHEEETENKKESVSFNRVYLYIQMQLCKKESLQDWLKENLLRDLPVVIQMFDQIIQAVEYIHLQGLIHRDLKPSNIFFSQDGQIKVGDFGLVTEDSEIDKLSSSISKQRRHTDQVGTLLYMSPEQEARKSYNHKVDIYSLGLIFFEMLHPFATQMERLKIMTDLKQMIFPDSFKQKYIEEYNLLQIMLAHDSDIRPTTFGIRARPPLRALQSDSFENIPEDLQFHLPMRQQAKRTSSGSSS